MKFLLGKTLMPFTLHDKDTYLQYLLHFLVEAFNKAQQMVL
jgi:hypothetical protein